MGGKIIYEVIKIENYVLYLRKSRADLELEAKGEMETLVRHEKALLELAKHQQLNVTKIYREIVSGETIQARPIVQQLLDEIEQGLWSGVLVMEIERLARGDTIDQGIVARAFKIGNAKIITPVKTFDPTNEYDEEYFEFGLFMSRREYKTINRRIQRGRVASVREGKFISPTPPYGYDKVKIEKDKGYTLKPNTEADAVKLIFDFYINGESMSVIAGKLDAMHIKPRYRDTWSKYTINDILKNPVYIGKIRWSYRPEKLQNIDGELKKCRAKNPDNCISVKGLHQAIIDDETFQKAQQQMESNTYKTVKKNCSLQNPFTGLIYCKKCGSLMTRLGKNKHTKYDTLICSNRYCNNVSVPMFLVEQKIIDNLSIWLSAYKFETKPIDKTAKTDNSMKAKKAVLKDLNIELKRIEIQITNTFNLVEQGIYTSEIFMQRNKVLSDKKDDVLAAISNIQADIQRESDVEIIKLNFIPKAENILKGYSELMTAKEKNDLLRTVIHRIEYLKECPNRRGQLYNDNFEVTIFPKYPQG